MYKTFLLIGAILGALSVAIGAFGAHSLRAILVANEKTDVFETASRYQFYHSLVILIVGILLLQMPNKYFSYSGYAFLVGILIFSGSLYILALTNIKWLGAITPIGGVALILGWILLIIGILAKPEF